MLYILDKVFLCENADAFKSCALDLIFFSLTPKLGECARDCIVLRLHELLFVVGKLLVTVMIRHMGLAHGEFVLFSDRLLDRG